MTRFLTVVFSWLWRLKGTGSQAILVEAGIWGFCCMASCPCCLKQKSMMHVLENCCKLDCVGADMQEVLGVSDKLSTVGNSIFMIRMVGLKEKTGID